MGFWAYFDESGHPVDPNVSAVSLGGLRATHDEWLSFSKEWTAALSTDNVPSFHMKELYSDSAKSPYRHWTNEKRQDFLMRLVGIITSRTQRLLGAVKPLLDPADRASIKNVYDETYPVCVRAAISDVAPTGQVHFVLARHQEISAVSMQEYHQRVTDAYAQWSNDRRLGMISFESPSNCPPLQAADLVAWELARGQKEPDKSRPSMQRLLKMDRLVYK